MRAAPAEWHRTSEAASFSGLGGLSAGDRVTSVVSHLSNEGAEADPQGFGDSDERIQGNIDQAAFDLSQALVGLTRTDPSPFHFQSYSSKSKFVGDRWTPLSD